VARSARGLRLVRRKGSETKATHERDANDAPARFPRRAVRERSPAAGDRAERHPSAAALG